MQISLQEYKTLLFVGKENGRKGGALTHAATAKGGKFIFRQVVVVGIHRQRSFCDLFFWQGGIRGDHGWIAERQQFSGLRLATWALRKYEEYWWQRLCEP
jgi:hypothetical protein